jgi:formamidopyrimidine-DNA glycosylase
MPELPEVETIKLQLAKYLVGHTIDSVEIPNVSSRAGRGFQIPNYEKIIGGEVTGTRRFGKVSVIDLSNGYSILTHVKLTGQFIYRGPNLPKPYTLSAKVIGGVPGPHTLVIFKLDHDGILYYNDVRRFGWIRIEKTEEVENEKFIAKLGPEPPVVKDFTGKFLTLELFQQILSKTSRAIKVVIMDQAKMGGVGNIYATDALWLAGIDPKRKSLSLSISETKKLYGAIITVLKEGIKWGGASELAFVTPDGTEGKYQNHTLAYGHTGELCPNCKKAKFEKYFLGGRGTYVCPNCQK